MGTEVFEELEQDNAKNEKSEFEKHEKEELCENRSAKDSESSQGQDRKISVERATKPKLDIKLNDSQKHVCVQLITRFLRYFSDDFKRLIKRLKIVQNNFQST